MLTTQERIEIWIQTHIASKGFAALDTAFFYVVFDLVFGVTLTWPILFAVAWVTDTVVISKFKADLKKKAIAKRLDIFGIGTGKDA